MCSTKKFIDPFAFLFPTHSAFPFPDIYLHAAREGGKRRRRCLLSQPIATQTRRGEGKKERSRDRHTSNERRGVGGRVTYE